MDIIPFTDVDGNTIYKARGKHHTFYSSDEDGFFLHRVGGPAVEVVNVRNANYYNEYWLNDKEFTKEEHAKLVTTPTEDQVTVGGLCQV